MANAPRRVSEVTAKAQQKKYYREEVADVLLQERPCIHWNVQTLIS